MELNVELKQKNNIYHSIGNRISVQKVERHNDLKNLDYESSGHTGFVPSKLSLINNNVTTSSDRRKVYLFADDNSNASKITLADIAKSVIRQSNFIPDDLQDGQYLFLELE